MPSPANQRLILVPASTNIIDGSKVLTIVGLGGRIVKIYGTAMDMIDEEKSKTTAMRLDGFLN
jgi:hypothetical protein